MPVRTGGDFPDPINTETEYAGLIQVPNTVGYRGDGPRELEPHEKLRLGYLTGQDEDEFAPRQTGFMGGVDDNFPEHPELEEFIPKDYQGDYIDDVRLQK